VVVADAAEVVVVTGAEVVVAASPKVEEDAAPPLSSLQAAAPSAAAAASTARTRVVAVRRTMAAAYAPTMPEHLRVEPARDGIVLLAPERCVPAAIEPATAIARAPRDLLITTKANAVARAGHPLDL
jgi:hypothetical protein